VFAEIPAVAMRRQTERTGFTDAEIIEGFMRIAFGAEYHMAGRVDRVRKYQKPVRIFVDGVRRPARVAQLQQVIAQIAQRVEHLDIAMTDRRADASVIITLVRDRDLNATIARLYGSDRAREIRSSLDPQCLSGFSKNDDFEIEHSDVLLAIDKGEFTFLDCAFEEILQSLGPINDTDTIPWTMFNDNVQMGYFDIYDQYILNILYHPRLRAGMTIAEVRGLLPDILPEVRRFVARNNGLEQ
jgi:hypothetical protein